LIHFWLLNIQQQIFQIYSGGSQVQQYLQSMQKLVRDDKWDNDFDWHSAQTLHGRHVFNSCCEKHVHGVIDNLTIRLH